MNQKNVKELPRFCPICGSVPKFNRESMGRPGGHGYPGHFSYEYSCPDCGLIKPGEASDVWCEKDLVEEQAIKNWNKNVEIVRGYLNGRTERIQKMMEAELERYE